MFNPNPAATGNCTIVFDIDEQKYLFVSESFYSLFEVGADHLRQNVDFLIGLVKPETFAGVKQLTEGLAMNESIQITYHLEASQKQLTEKRTFATDGLTGHKIILSNITSALEGVRTPIPFIKPGLSEQFLNSLIDSQTNFLVRIDINGRFSFANRRFFKTFGYDEADIIGHHFSKTTIPEDAQLCQEAFVECINNPGKIVRLAHKKPAKNGNLHDTEWEFVSIADDNGMVVEIQGIGRDITSQMQMREEALHMKDSLEALINNTRDHIWSVDKELRYLYMNQAYVEQVTHLTGQKPFKGEYSYKHQGFGKQLIDDWTVYYNRALSGERYDIISESIDPVNGQRLYYEVNFNPIYTAAGDIIGAGCFGHDITERLKIQKELVSQNDRLRNVASLSSHELRRPVASMLGLISLMDHEDFFNPENKEIIAHLFTVSAEIDTAIRLVVDSTIAK
ncbi:PAS domain-containing protein [Mucilaginibacter sp. NFR10]|jgi:PAS domain S-box-containing protein|uniref:PAS domain S-box protein n=1 Tax=Mucilaginibacter sp. NFR10 TaxID=1566292 RepID=UPI00087160EB|nr:PAS domain-containing protein [Mucilaginibacter sp. NFR10]SCW76776.1 PAS domain S-box-containing protein [Mucilaginibacter sp. NFR10]